MGSFFSFFEESEEEIRADLKEARRTVRDLNQKLKDFEPKPKKKKKKLSFLFLVPLIVIIIIALILFTKPSRTEECKIEGEDSVLIACMEFTEIEDNDHRLEFYLKNNQDKETKCFLKSLIKMNDIEISRKIYELGSYASFETRKEEIVITLPSGDSQYNFTPECT